MNPHDTQLESLIAGYVDGRLSADEEVLLRLRLSEDAQARDQFVAAIDLQAMLVGNAKLAGGALAAADIRAWAGWRGRVGRSVGSIRRKLGWKAAAACMLVALVTWQWAQPQLRFFNGDLLQDAWHVATWGWKQPHVRFVNGVGHQFTSDEPGPHRELIGRSFKLAAGLIELGFRQSDATVIIEAPARFTIKDSKTLLVDSGRVTAHVRDGKKGLRVHTPHTEVLDLGTRFAIDVSRSDRSEVHVFEGKVEAGVAKAGARHLLTANEAWRFVEGGQSAACDVRKAAFVQREELRPLASGLSFDQGTHAKKAFERIKRDPALLAAIVFESGEEQPVVVEIDGPRAVQGRFAGSRALDFAEINDKVRLNTSATAQQFTLMTWVRLDCHALESDDRETLYRSGEPGISGDVHWAINQKGRVQFALGEGGTSTPWAQTRVWTESKRPLLETLYRWTHLAVTCDVEAKQVAFYFNGRLDSSVELAQAVPAVLGPAEIGNCEPAAAGKRHVLQGRMDEFVILSRAFSTDEIQAYYAATTPYR